MTRRLAAVLFAAAGVVACAADAHAQTTVTRFSGASPGAALPAPWKLVTLPRIGKHTHYSLVADSGSTVLRAEATASMASVAHPLHGDAHAAPIIQWRWKIARVLRTSDMATKGGDDFPARLYVLFDYDIGRLPFTTRANIRMARAHFGDDIPLAVLCYVWDGKAPAGAAAWSPYSDRVRVIVVQSGEARVNQWVMQTRNVVDDFRAAFGEEPPAISGVAVATDTDNTGESAVAFYGDIRFTR